MTYFKNAAPQNVALGIDDQSIRQRRPDPEALPTHLPKFYIYAEDGPTSPELVVGNTMVSMYGQTSFDEKSPYFNHATLFLREINAQGNACMVERVRPDNAGPNATLRLSLDVLKTQVPVYERNPDDGSIVYDQFGDPVETDDTIAGYKCFWVAEEITALPGTGADGFAAGTSRPGNQTDLVAQTQSVLYPVIDLRVPHFGKRGSNTGFRIWAPTVNSEPSVHDAILTSGKAYPFHVTCVRRADEFSTGVVQLTQSAEPYIVTTLKRDVENPVTERFIGIDNIFIDAYQMLGDEVYSDHYGPFGRVHVYQNNLDTLCTQFHEAEIPFIDPNSHDFTADAEDRFLFNIISGHSSVGVNYHSFVMDNANPLAVVLSENSVVYARGGSDGTMDNAKFAKLVADGISEYANRLSPLMDLAKYPESIFYDSGFPLETKKQLFKFISVRKDTFVVMATHDVDARDLTASEETSIAQTLKTMGQLYPESEFYGTPVARAMIVGRSGEYQNSSYAKKVPLSLDIARKAARYMGASDGVWKREFRFSRAPGSILEDFKNINIEFTPQAVRNKDWDNGLVWVQSYRRKSVFFPALKTIYDNDTSVLNSFITAMACVELQKVGDRAWREFSGSDDLTNGQLIELNNQFIADSVEGRFDGRFEIIPETEITASDEVNGFSWHHKIIIRAAGLKTVGVFTVEAQRLDDPVNT